MKLSDKHAREIEDIVSFFNKTASRYFTQKELSPLCILIEHYDKHGGVHGSNRLPEETLCEKSASDIKSELAENVILKNNNAYSMKDFVKIASTLTDKSKMHGVFDSVNLVGDNMHIIKFARDISVENSDIISQLASVNGVNTSFIVTDEQRKNFYAILGAID